MRLLAGDASGASAALAPWLNGAPAAFGSTRAELWLLDALAHDAEGDVEAAAVSLERALDEAEPHGLRRPFVELGPSAAALLRRQLRHGTSAHRSLVDDLLRDFESSGPDHGRRPCCSSSCRIARRPCCASCPR